MLSCASRYLWLKLANVKVSESMLTYKAKFVGQKHINEGLHFSASPY